MYLLFTSAAFLGAVLVFSIQPMAGKLLLPQVGGTSSVWNSAMLFFQAVLLLGYLYAHLSSRWLGPARQWKLHLLLLAAGFLFLPVALNGAGDSSLPTDAPALWVLFALSTALLWPLLMVSATAPLLQRWLSATDHRAAANPYPLYAASNSGSVVALLAYPFLVEPWLGLATQARLWSVGYVLLALTLAGCAIYLHRRSGPRVRNFGVLVTEPLDWRVRARWFGWAFVPSSLLLSVTSLITTDLAPMPLLWVVPLLLFLLSHIHAFARRRLLPTRWLMRAAPPAVSAAAIALSMDLFEPIPLLMGVHLGAFLIVALLFHGLLSDHRPAPAHLTEFYLWIALGGLAGGLFNGMVAPALFDHLLEHPAVLAAALLMLPAVAWEDRFARWSFRLSVATTVGLAAWLTWNGNGQTSMQLIVAIVCMAGAAVLLSVAGRHGAARGAALVASVVALAMLWWSDAGEMLSRRSYYAAHKVFLGVDGEYNVLTHGNTVHGVQRRAPGHLDIPLTYYHPDGPLGDIFAALNSAEGDGDIAVVGLGTGSIATYHRPGRKMVFYEIDPVVVELAADPRLFTFIRACGLSCVIKVGDGRRRLAREPRERFRLIVLDAYSSGSIPLHLLTYEAMGSFLERLKPDGLIAAHVSNSYVSLGPIISRIGEAHGLTVAGRRGGAGGESWVSDSEWVVLSRNGVLLETIGRIARESGAAGWEPVPAAQYLWTDDFSPIWEAYAGR